jgi:5S rRNA maturation endonuclease (ribonuclease M5)
MSSLERRKEKLDRILWRLAGESNSGTVIIVEGRRDKEALRRLGLKGPILCFKSSRRSLADFLSDINGNKAIILTDFDREGRELSSRIAEELAYRKIRADHALRERLGALVRQDARTIQDLFGCVERMRAEELRRLVSSRSVKATP